MKLQSKFRKGLTALLISVTFGSVGILTPLSSASAEALDKSGVEKIVREYLLNNPEILIEVQDALKAKQEHLKLARQAQTLADKKDQIYNSPHQMIIGDPNAKFTLVEFFDYNCAFCKRALSDMNRIVDENPDVKFVMKEFPVLGENSLEAARISLSLIKNNPELYKDFHEKLLGNNGRKDGQSALDIAVALGADGKTIRDGANDPAIMDAISEVYDLADGLGISGTPSYVVGNEVIFGAVGYDKLMPKIANLRQCGKASC